MYTQSAWERVSECRTAIVNIAYPSVIVFVEDPDKLACLELEFVVHGRLKVELNAVDIACWWRTGRAASVDRCGAHGGAVGQI